MNPVLIVEQHVASDPASVYAAWTSADRLAAWWWPQLSDTTYAVDATVGGHYRIESKGAGIGVRGEYLRLNPPHEIAMTWEWLTDGEADPPEQVSVRFEAVDGGTLVRVTHEPATPEATTTYREGWESVLDRLAAYRAA